MRKPGTCLPTGNYHLPAVCGRRIKVTKQTSAATISRHAFLNLDYRWAVNADSDTAQFAVAEGARHMSACCSCTTNVEPVASDHQFTRRISAKVLYT